MVKHVHVDFSVLWAEFEYFLLMTSLGGRPVGRRIRVLDTVRAARADDVNMVKTAGIAVPTLHSTVNCCFVFFSFVSTARELLRLCVSFYLS